MKWTQEDLHRFALDVVNNPTPEDLAREACAPEALRIHEHQYYDGTLRLLNELYECTEPKRLGSVVQTADNIIRGSGITNPADGLALLAACRFGKSYQNCLKLKLEMVERDIEYVSAGYLLAREAARELPMTASSVRVFMRDGADGIRRVQVEGWIPDTELNVFATVSIEDAFQYRAMGIQLHHFIPANTNLRAA